jgi:hypothetical protein
VSDHRERRRVLGKELTDLYRNRAEYHRRMKEEVGVDRGLALALVLFVLMAAATVTFLVFM